MRHLADRGIALQKIQDMGQGSGSLHERYMTLHRYIAGSVKSIGANHARTKVGYQHYN